jgi:hypothetical protein
LEEGGWLPLLIVAVISFLMLTWRKGEEVMDAASAVAGPAIALGGTDGRRAGMCDRQPYGSDALWARDNEKAARAPTRLKRLPVLRCER